MRLLNLNFNKAFIITTGCIILAIILVFILISPVAKYQIEKYDEKFLGRQIEIGRIYVNPFTGYVHISNLKIYESITLPDSIAEDSVIFSSKELIANFAMLKMFSKTIEIADLKLIQPKGIIIQYKSDFNFNDLVDKFTPIIPRKISSRLHFNILRLKIKNGEFYYFEKIIPVKYHIREVDFESNGKYWNVDTIAAKFSFLPGTGSGSVKGDFTINLKNRDYRLAAVFNKFDLQFIEQYLKDLVNYGTFRANLDADIKATGNLKDRESLDAKGRLVLNDFHVGINPDEDYASFEKLIVNIDQLCPKDHKYLFDTISLSKPYLKYERYDYLDNLQRMFGKNGANISEAKANPTKFNLILKIADYVEILARNFFRSDYKISRLAIDNGILQYNDYSLSEKFSIEANPINAEADSVNKNRRRVEVTLKSGIQPYGNILIALSINPKDSGDFDIQYNFQRLPASIFNPYLITYTSFPLDRGTIELNGTWHVRNGIIKSKNRLLVIDPHLARRLINDDMKWIPSPLIMSIIRERGNVIDYNIPITGNLKDPKFHLKNVAFDILRNIFVKPATIPYGQNVKTLENEIDKSLALRWSMRQNSLQPDQEKFVTKIADFLHKNPGASISVYPLQYAEKEKEYISFFEAKKKYFLLTQTHNISYLTEDDSLMVDNMSVKDSSFVAYLNRQLNDTMLFTIQEKCNNFIGLSLLNAKFSQLNNERKETFLLLFADRAAENQVKFYAGENNVPYNGYSFYNITYPGGIPESLIKAYLHMDELNNKIPRKKFKIKREKINSVR